MAKPLDQVENEDMEQDKGSSDAELVSMMGMAMLNNGGLKVIEDALNSSQDPGQVVGQFLAQLTGQIAEMAQNEMGVDPGIFLQDGSFVDQMLDYIERKLGLPREFSDQVYDEVLEAIKAAAQAPAPQEQPAGPVGLDQGGM